LDENGLKNAPGSLAVLTSLADLYLQSGLVDQAVELLKSAIENNPSYIPAYQKLIESYLLKGNINMAKSHLSKALRIDPENKLLLTIKEKVFKEQGETSSNIAEKLSTETQQIKAKETPPLEERHEEEKEATEEAIKKGQKVLTEKEADPIKMILNPLFSIEEILGTILSDNSGLLISQVVKVPIDTESTGALISSILLETMETIKKINLGDLEYLIFELPKGKIFVLASPPLVLTILTGKNIQQGIVLLEAKKTLMRLKESLGV